MPRLLELMAIRPAGMLLPGRQMQIAAHRPHAGGFLLGFVQTPPQGRTQGGQWIDMHRLHCAYLQSVSYQIAAP